MNVDSLFSSFLFKLSNLVLLQSIIIDLHYETDGLQKANNKKCYSALSILSLL